MSNSDAGLCLPHPFVFQNVSQSCAFSLLNVFPPTSLCFCPLIGHNMELVYINLNKHKEQVEHGTLLLFLGVFYLQAILI